jgi:hypothetical protein
MSITALMRHTVRDSVEFVQKHCISFSAVSDNADAATALSPVLLVLFQISS